MPIIASGVLKEDTNLKGRRLFSGAARDSSAKKERISMAQGLSQLPRSWAGGLRVQPGDLDGSIAPTVVSVNANYPIGAGDGFVIVNTAGGSVTVTLPPASQIAPFGRRVRLLKLTKVNTLTILPAAGDFIFGGVTSEVLYNAFSTLELMSDGGHHWYPHPTHFMAADQSTAVVTANYTVLDADYKLLADATAGAFTIQLPSTSAFATGHEFRFEKIDGSSNAVTVAAFSGDTIEGAATVALASQYASLRVTSNGASSAGVWYRL
jgi:hypothetical protein